MAAPEFPNLELVLNKYAVALMQSLNDKGIKQTSDLSQSIEVTQDVQPLKTVYEILMNEYWYYIDQGRGKTNTGSQPGEVREAIRQWIRKNSIQAEERNGVKPTQEQLSYLITRKIHREGYPGRDFVSQVFENFEQELEEAMLQDLEDNIKAFMERMAEAWH